MENLYTLKEAAEISGYSYRYLAALCLAKKVAHVRRGGRYFFTPEDVKRLTVHVEPVDNKEQCA